MAILHTQLALMPGVPLYLYAVKGERYSVLIDTGVAPMREQVLALCQEAGHVRYVLLTHAHADHIGCNRAVRETTGAHFAAAGAFPWVEDLETHYREFCLPEQVLEEAGQREEIIGLMDGAGPIDVQLVEGTSFRLGDEVVLSTVALPGHKLEEVAFLERSSRSLIMGDVLLALAAPFFHGFQTARGFRRSLERLKTMLESGEVARILPAHHPPLEAEAAHQEIAKTAAFLHEVEAVTLASATGVTFETLWQTVCQKMNKQLEFRGYAMLQVQLHELTEEGKVVVDGERFLRA